MRLFILALFFALPVKADPRAALYDTWGTSDQCAGRLLLPKGTKRAAPFEIRPGWLRQGELWCKLTWFPAQTRENGLYVSTRATCGEDSARGYRLDFLLADGEMMLIWDEALANGPLARCTAG